MRGQDWLADLVKNIARQRCNTNLRQSLKNICWIVKHKYEHPINNILSFDLLFAFLLLITKEYPS